MHKGRKVLSARYLSRVEWEASRYLRGSDKRGHTPTVAANPVKQRDLTPKRLVA